MDNPARFDVVAAAANQNLNPPLILWCVGIGDGVLFWLRLSLSHKKVYVLSWPQAGRCVR